MNEDNLTTAQKLTNIENDMKNKIGPLDFNFNTNDITSAIKSMKLNKANLGSTPKFRRRRGANLGKCWKNLKVIGFLTFSGTF